MKNLLILQDRLGVRFKNPLVLQQALTHRSYLNENRPLKLQSYERLEFLGDAVLSIVVREEIFHRFPNADEGFLTQVDNSLVNGENALALAVKLELNDFLLLSKGEQRDMKSRPSILADVIEAIIGAIYIDLGFKAARAFIGKFILISLPATIDVAKLKDSKTLLQELTQEKVGHTPQYKVTNESGPDHDKRFMVGVYIGESLLAEAEGQSKVGAEKKAAELALQRIGS